jgi:hypothetical protein
MFVKNGFTCCELDNNKKVKMATNAIVLSSNVNIDSVTFGEVKVNKQGGKGIAFKYDNQSFQLRLPRMKFPGGLIQREDASSGNISYSLIGSLKGCDPYAKERSIDDENGPLYNFLLDLQDKVVSYATENSAKWFGKKRSEESIRDSFKSMLSVSTDKVENEYVPNGKYPPSFRLKVPVYDGRVAMDVVDARTMPYHLTVDSLRSVFPKYVEANLIVSGSIYIIGQSFGVTWRITFAQVFQPSRVTAATIFAKEEEVAAHQTEESEHSAADVEPPEVVQRSFPDVPTSLSSSPSTLLSSKKRRPAV